ncbi:MAG: RelA/SpoT family protein [Bacteroidales bacterium]|jgi:GTP pyrophosphokinase|nr:RelA/SpoT family protein [Bacteroidales bacterium]
MKEDAEKIFVNRETERKYRMLLKAGKNVLQDDTSDFREAFRLIEHEGWGISSTLYGQSALDFGLDLALIAVEELGLRKPSVLASMLYHFVRSDPKGEVTSRETARMEMIRRLFGEKVAVITGELACISGISVKDSIHQAENFRNMLLSMVTDINVILIKLGERLKLMRMLERFPEKERYTFASDTFFLFAPLAHRLGLYNIKSEMEDLSLKQIQPESYCNITRKLAETTTKRNRFIKEFVQPIHDELARQGFDFTVKARLKSVYSIYNKMVKQRIDFEEVYDLFAIRIILSSPLHREKSDCWHVYSTVTDLYQPNPLRMRDWISVPKSNGYESLHTTVIGPEGRWVEVQIRTARMDEIAEKGLAAHWKYKGGQADENMEQLLQQIRESLDSQDIEISERLNNMKLNLYSKEIFVFTPKGDLRKLPVGATVLDFAFDIHTGVGAMCIGGKVNGKNVPIRHVLQNGDRVEITTFKNQKPNADWLNIVVTSKARNRIKALLKDEEHKISEQGREILMRRFKNWKLPMDDYALKIIQKLHKVKTYTEVYALAVDNKLDFPAIKEAVSTVEEKVKTPDKIDQQAIKKLARPRHGKDDEKTLISIDGKTGDWDFKLAKCCNPVYGDRIFAFVTINEGVKIHRENCPNAKQMAERYGYRIMDAHWVDSEQELLYQTDLWVTGYDETGVVNRLTDVISKELNTAIRSISLQTNDGVFEGTLSVMVADITRLNTLINKIRKVKGIIKANRIAT